MLPGPPLVLLCSSPVKSLARVFAGMSDGLVAVYSLVEELPLEGEAYLCSHTLNKTVFALKDSDPRQRPYPVSSMALVSSGSQLWFSNGPGVLVVDCQNLQAVRRLEAYDPPSSIVSMAASFSLWGEEAVWTLDDLTNTLLLHHAASYQLCARYCCGDSSPLRDVFAVRHPAGVAVPTGCRPDLEPASQEEWRRRTGGDVTLIYSEEAGTQILQHQDSQTDYCSISSSGSGGAGHASSSPASPPAEPQETSRDQDQHQHQDQDQQAPTDPESDGASAGTVKPSPPQLQAVTVLPVNGALWIPRRGGDIIVIEMQSHDGHLRGRVTAVLRPPGCSSLGTLEAAALVAKDTVVCGFHQDNRAWSLCVWRGWGRRELDVFYRSYEELGRLETSMRKRR